MDKEDLKLLPLVAVGLVRALGELVLVPLAQSLVARVNIPSQEDIDSHIAASIQFYHTDD